MAVIEMIGTAAGEPSSSSNQVSGEAPSGFILKLFQMVNGAPDEVISVSHLVLDSLQNHPSSCFSVFLFLRKLVILRDVTRVGCFVASFHVWKEMILRQNGSSNLRSHHRRSAFVLWTAECHLCRFSWNRPLKGRYLSLSFIWI
jgi:hypothetical protein